MSSGDVHEVTAMMLLPAQSCILGLFQVPFFEFIYFQFLYIVGVYIITCDLDTESNSSKILGIFGWIINKLFKHQGILHNPYFWTAVGVVGYFSIGWFWIGLIIPQYIHLVMDWIF